MSTARLVHLVTGTRAEFGLLRPVLDAVTAHPGLSLRLTVTGTHLITDSWQDIAAAGYDAEDRVTMQHPGDVGRAADAAALGRGVSGLSQRFTQTDPAFVVVLGDRIEAFAAASAAAVGGWRVAHLHGGDRAEGVADESMRHAITKLAHLHFPGCPGSRDRLVRMGEDPATIFCHGSPAVDGLDEIVPADDAPEVLVMQHPVGDDDDTEAARMRATLQATAGRRRLVMMPNHDPGRGGIVAAIREAGVATRDHLPRGRFLSLLKGARVLVGNSSAGLIEAAALRTPAVNLGQRQAGRDRPASVVDCGHEAEAIARAVERAIAMDLSALVHLYGDGQTGPRIAQTLAGVDLAAAPLRKRNMY